MFLENIIKVLGCVCFKKRKFIPKVNVVLYKSHISMFICVIIIEIIVYEIKQKYM